MKKTLILILIFCLLSLTAWWVVFINSQKKNVSIQGNQEASHTGTIVQEEVLEAPSDELDKHELVRQKIENIKKRLALKWLIIEGDGYFRKQQLAHALKKYLEFYKQNPDDPLINEKIWDTYYEMKKFGSALNYYNKLLSSNTQTHVKIADTLFYTSDFWDTENIWILREKLAEIWLSEEELFYYNTSLACYNDFHACKLSFWEYFWPEIKEEIEVWNTDIEEKDTFKNLENIKNAIENYRNFQVDDVYLKDAYIIWAWYSNKLYPLAIIMWEKLLEEKPWYKPILQIVAQSYFELGEYEKAREVLWQYYQKNDENPSVAYMLWIINTNLREYVLANIYFQKSIELWYSESVNAYRQIIYNFYTLEDDENMLQSFVKLIEKEENFEMEDLRLAIYYHILHEKYDWALEWSKKWQKLFSESADFYAYEAWILREEWKFEESTSVLEAGLVIEEENPFLLINIAYNELKKENKSAALVIFKKIIQAFPESEFSVQSQKEIDIIAENS